MAKKTLTSKRERTRQSIINAAITIIAEKGLPGTSIDELMAHTGMARGTFYNYFQTREELLTSTIEQMRDKFHEAVILKLPQDVANNITVACTLYGLISYCMANQDIGWAMIRLSSDTDFLQPPPQDDHRFQHTNTALMTGLKREIPFVVAQTYIIGNMNSLLHSLLRKDITKEQAETMLILILRGLGTEEKEVDNIIEFARNFANQLSEEFNSSGP